jgi:cell division protein FtsB
VDHRIEEQNSEAENSSPFFRRNARYFFALAFCLLVLQDVFGAHGLMAMHRSKVELRTVQAQIEKLDKENQELQQHIHNLKTDPSAIEKIARDRMGLARPGELIFSMPSAKDGSKASAASPQR